MYAVVRVRGSVHVAKDSKETLQMLRLHRVNHLVLVPKNDSAVGMVKKVQAFVTYGEITVETLAKLLEKRGKLQGDRKIDGEFLKKNKFKGFKELAQAVADGKAQLQQLEIKPVFRLKPPRKGHARAGIKKGYSIGGALGYRASDMDELVKRMV